MDNVEMALRKNAIRKEVDELKKTVLHLLIDAYNGTTTEADVKSTNLVDFRSAMMIIVEAIIIVVLAAFVFALFFRLAMLRRECLCLRRRIEDIENPMDVIENEEEENEQEDEEEKDVPTPSESASERESEPDSEEQPPSIRFIGGDVSFCVRPISLAVVRSFELPSPQSNAD